MTEGEGERGESAWLVCMSNMYKEQWTEDVGAPSTKEDYISLLNMIILLICQLYPI
jgi:hypothetical protein